MKKNPERSRKNMTEYPLTKLRETDILLKGKIESLEYPHPRYYDDIIDYFTSLQRNACVTGENRYRSVLDVIRRLWVTSSKNPSIFREARDFEPILFRIPRYRDHFIHSFNVFLLGYYIINELKRVKPDFSLKSNDYNLTWMLASTFHDVAYAIQKMELWFNEMLEKFLGANPNFSFNITQVMPLIYVDFMRLISRWHARSQMETDSGRTLTIADWSFYNEISSKLVEKDHGVLGGLMLAHLLAVREGFARKRKWDFLYNHLPACHAITVHHLKSIPIELIKHPIAFVLTLCDELQDWGRPSDQANQNILYLDQMNIEEDGDRPKIQFVIEISETRKDRLKKALSNLRASKKAKIIIMDTQNNEVYSIRD